jgi:hypothetical protein
VKVVTEVTGNTVVKRPIFHYFTKDNKKYTRGKYPSKYHSRIWIVERTNSWYRRFIKLFTK